MPELIEALLQLLFEGGVEFAYRKWGWPGVIAAFSAPVLLIGGMILLALRV
ncbi:hypothetical protein ACG3SL_13735 [Sphingomonas sp. CJ20]